jgi:DNA-binding transcriptional LysR family regulator
MQSFDHLSLDGHTLRTFLMVLDEMSVSRAAEQLGVTQSTVSHTLDKLRAALGDQLFVRYGRGIAATERAIQLREPVQNLLNNMKGLLDDRPFDPAQEVMQFVVAANDFQRDMIFTKVMTRSRAAGIDLRLHFHPSGIPTQKTLYEGHCDLILSPSPPESHDVLSSVLFRDHHVCYYDANQREAPQTLDEYVASPQAAVVFQGNANSWSFMPAAFRSIDRTIVVSVPNFAALQSFILGTDIIATEWTRQKNVGLSDLDWAPLPFEAPECTMYMAWHRRDQHNPAHRWLRDQISEVAESL